MGRKPFGDKMTGPLLAIFVGGRSSRMGTDKGLLPSPTGEGNLLESLIDAGRAAGLPVVLVGNAPAYASIAPEVPRVHDRPVGSGPLGGLGGGLAFASAKGLSSMIAVACDMPYVTGEVLRMLADNPSQKPVLAPKRGPEAPWEPLLARYDVGRVAPVLDEVLVSGKRSFQALLSMLEVEPLPLTDAVDGALRDWDTPQDMQA